MNVAKSYMKMNIITPMIWEENIVLKIAPKKQMEFEKQNGRKNIMIGEKNE